MNDGIVCADKDILLSIIREQLVANNASEYSLTYLPEDILYKLIQRGFSLIKSSEGLEMKINGMKKEYRISGYNIIEVNKGKGDLYRYINAMNRDGMWEYFNY